MTLVHHVLTIHGDHSFSASAQTQLFKYVGLSVDCKWPTTLVLSKQVCTKLELLFRLLFHVKFVDFATTTTIAMSSSSNSKDKETLLLKQQMRHFVTNVLHYLLFEVVQVKFNALNINIRDNVDTVETLIAMVSDYTDSVMRECLLTHQVLLQDLVQLLDMVLEMSPQFEQKSRQFIRKLSEEACTNKYFFLNNLCARLDFNDFYGTTT